MTHECNTCHRELPADDFEVVRNQWGKSYRRKKCNRCRAFDTLRNYYLRTIGIVSRRKRSKYDLESMMSRQDFRLIFGRDPASDDERRSAAAMNIAQRTRLLFHAPLNALRA